MPAYLLNHIFGYLALLVHTNQCVIYLPVTHLQLAQHNRAVLEPPRVDDSHLQSVLSLSALPAIQLTLVSLFLLEIVPSTLSASSLCEDDAANTCSISFKSNCNFFDLSAHCSLFLTCLYNFSSSIPSQTVPFTLSIGIFVQFNVFKGPFGWGTFRTAWIIHSFVSYCLLSLDELLCFPASCRVWRSPGVVEVRVQWAGRRAAGSRRTLSKWLVSCFCRRKSRICKCERTVSRDRYAGRRTGPNRCRVHRVHRPVDSRVPQPLFAPFRVLPLQRPDSSSPLHIPGEFATLQSIIHTQTKEALVIPYYLANISFMSISFTIGLWTSVIPFTVVCRVRCCTIRSNNRHRGTCLSSQGTCKLMNAWREERGS